MAQYNDEEIYPNQPLSDVACEVRFKGEMQVECQRYLFWEEIREAYPDILVPFAQDGEPVALQHYKFRNPGNGRTVAVALNSLVYSEAKYSGHKSFTAEFARLIGTFTRLYPRLGQITRVGWRYINVMPFSREDGLVPLSRILRLNISFPDKIFEQTSALNVEWAGKCLGGEVTIRLSAAKQKAVPGQEALILDLDFARTGPDLKWETVKEVIVDARSKCRGIFEDMITDEYRNYLRGKTI